MTGIATKPLAAGGLMTRERWWGVGRIVGVGVVILLYAGHLVGLPVLLATVAVGLYPLVKTGALDLVRERKIGTEIFVTVATVIAMLGREYLAGSILMLIILCAELIAAWNTDRARASIKALLGSVPRIAHLRGPDGEHDVPVDQLRQDDLVLVRAGEQIPVDGVVQGGDGTVNESPITGESVPKSKGVGAPVFAGTVLELGALDVRTEKVGGATMFSRIVALVETAEDAKAPVEKLADRVATWLIPVVAVFLIGVYLATRDVRLVITLLIFTSPAELGLATPLVVIASIARAARSGILLKGGIYLEELAKVQVIAFDKTGTLTLGRFEVTRVDSGGGIAEDELLRLVGSLERRSSHPLADAVVRSAVARGLVLSEPSQFEVVRGLGVRGLIDGRAVIAGSAAFLREGGVEVPAVPDVESESRIYVAVDGHAAGVLALADRPRPGAREAIARLRLSGLWTVMLTGDNPAIAERIGAELGVDQVEAALLPDAKVDAIRRLQSGGRKVAMVGDGINDAPALAAADVGIAMGVAGTQAAMEAADVALMTEDLGKIVEARAIAARAYRTIKQNLIVGVGVVHLLGIAAALLRLIGPVEAAAIHLGPDLLVFANSIRLLRGRI